jgi:hypothetical protein
MSLKNYAGNVAGTVILGLMIASCAMDDARDVQVRDKEGAPPATVSPQQRLEQQRQLEERQRDQRQQDRRQQDLERAQQGVESPSSAHASSITKVPNEAGVVGRGSERIVGQSDSGVRGTRGLGSAAPEGSQVKGELLRMEGEYFVIRDVNGQEIRLQVDNATKMENAVQVGDKIEAHVSGSNHAESVRSVDKPKKLE